VNGVSCPVRKDTETQTQVKSPDDTDNRKTVLLETRLICDMGKQCKGEKHGAKILHH